MTHDDPRETVYRKRGKKYVPCGTLNDPYTYDGFKSEGLWLHTRKDGGCTQSMTLIARLDDLPTSAASFAAAMQHKNELVGFISKLSEHGLSRNDIAHEILRWVAIKGGES